MRGSPDDRVGDGGCDDGVRVQTGQIRITVVGGGFAAAELLLALRALAEDRVHLELLTPDTRLPFRVAATGEPFGAARVDTYDLAGLAADVGATVRRDTAEAVAPRAHRLRLRSGASADYDVLVLAIGARATAAVPGALTFRDQRDIHHVRRIADELRAGAIGSVVFVVPSGVAWTLPLYELALLTANHVAGTNLNADVRLATPEQRPLEVFGPGVSEQVEALLYDRGIRLHRRVRPRTVTGAGLELGYGEVIVAERIVAIPRLVGRRLTGIPADWNSFIPIDSKSRVLGVSDVFAVGDVTDFPVKQGGLATQQAEIVAHQLAARAGAAVDEPEPARVLRSYLLGADGPLFLRAQLDAAGRPVAPHGTPQVSPDPLWWPPSKLFGRYLTPWMAATRGQMRQSADWRPTD